LESKMPQQDAHLHAVRRRRIVVQDHSPSLIEPAARRDGVTSAERSGASRQSRRASDALRRCCSSREWEQRVGGPAPIEPLF
jgi:hypothetical protein